MIYDCQCKVCGKIEEIIRTISCRYDTPICCDKRMDLVILDVNISVVDFVTSDITGSPLHITSHKQHDRLCKENNVAPMGMKGEF